MKVVSPLVGERVGDICRRIFFMMVDGHEPVITHFNNVTIMFSIDDEGLHHGGNIDLVECEHIRGMSDKELIKKNEEWWELRRLESTAKKDGIE